MRLTPEREQEIKEQIEAYEELFCEIAALRVERDLARKELKQIKAMLKPG